MLQSQHNYELLQKKPCKQFNSQKLQKSILINLSKKLTTFNNANDKTLMKLIEEDTKTTGKTFRFIDGKK
jgi:biotin-(acetyl-CoA carboxylase) ligase